jgi:hypothetical protein
MADNTSFLKIGCRTKIFSIGIIVGCLGGLIWQELLAPLEITPGMDRGSEIQLFKEDTNEKLLEYIEGKWSSSIGDLVIDLGDSKVNGSFTVIENADEQNKVTKKFKIFNIESVDGFFGIVKLNICNIDSLCTQENILPIQINKVFGVSNTIAMSFDRRLTFCINLDEWCTRAFKRIE